MKAIYKRRSIRKYSKQEVSRNDIEAVIKAGMNAPSAGNEQPWHFIVIDKRDMLDRIPSVHPHSSMLKDAAAAIIVCGDLSLEKHEGFWVQDCSAAVENMLLEITDRGLASVWLGVYPRMERVNGIRAMFSIPENVIPFAVLPLGYPAEEKPENDKFDPSRVHDNMW